MNQIPLLIKKQPDADQAILLFQHEDYCIYWLGISEETAFRSNTYLIQSGDEALLVDPGHRAYFQAVHKQVVAIIPPEQLTGIILCHQDPDVCASVVDWLDLAPDLQVISSPRTNVLIPYYGISDYRFFDIVENPLFNFANDRQIQFIEAPFLHFAGAFTSYDCTSGMLFSGDIWAAIQLSWRLIVENFEAHTQFLDLFHIDYMASNIACRGFVEKIQDYQINAILPQHGSIISAEDVPAALEYLVHLQCGTDIIYPHLDND